jgi:putative transposase
MAAIGTQAACATYMSPRPMYTMDREQKPAQHRLRSFRCTLRARWYMLTTVTAVRRPLFERADAASIVANAFRHYHDTERVHGFAWVVMPDHIHWVIQLRVGTLAWLMRAFKSWTSTQARKVLLNPPPVVWMRGFHDRMIRENEDVARYIEYVVLNPVRAGLVDHPKRYPWVYGESELMDVHGTEPPPVSVERVAATQQLPWAKSRP